MAKYDNDKPYPVTGGKTIPDLKIDIEEYIVDNTQGFVTAPITHNMLKNVINSIPLGGSTKFNINNLSDRDILVRVGTNPENAKWENTQNYTYHSSGTRTEVYSVDEVYHKDLLYTTGQTYTKTEVDAEFLKYYNSGDTYSKSEIDSMLEDDDIIILNSGNTNINSPSTGSISINGINRTYYDSIFWDGNKWVNKPAFDTDSISEIIDNILEDGLPTISGYTVEEWVRSQFETDVHVNQSAVTNYDDSDGEGNLILWNDGNYGATWQSSIFWRAQYGTQPTQNYINQMQIAFDETSGDGSGDFILKLNKDGGSSSDVTQVMKIDKQGKSTFNGDSLIEGTLTVDGFVRGKSNAIFGNPSNINTRINGGFISGGIDGFNEIIYYPIQGDSRNVSILGGKDNKIQLCYNTSILGGEGNSIMDDIEWTTPGENISIIGGKNNKIDANQCRNSIILGGEENELELGCRNSGIINGEGIKFWGYSDNCLITGKYNYYEEFYTQDKLFIIGNGTNDSNRSDAFVVKDNGDVSSSGFMKSKKLSFYENNGGEATSNFIDNTLFTNVTYNQIKDLMFSISFRCRLRKTSGDDGFVECYNRIFLKKSDYYLRLTDWFDLDVRYFAKSESSFLNSSIATSSIRNLDKIWDSSVIADQDNWKTDHGTGSTGLGNTGADQIYNGTGTFDIVFSYRTPTVDAEVNNRFIESHLF